VRVWLGTYGAKALDVSHLELVLDQPQLRRGDRVSARLKVGDPGRALGSLSAEVQCSETYYYRSSSSSSSSGSSAPRRVQTTHELWTFPMALGEAPGEYAVVFDIPRELPPSWPGSWVIYTWTLTVTERVERGLDPQVELPLAVLP
jgi:hypothetical protein